MKKLLLILALTSCAKDENRAAVIAKSRATAGTSCDSVTLKGLEIAVCQTPEKVDVIAVYSEAYPFQAFVFKSAAKIKAEQAPPPPPTGSAEKP